MNNLSATELFELANLQMAAEAFLHNNGVGPLDTDVLERGNGRASKFPAQLAADMAASGWTVKAHRPSDTTGFSGTLFEHADGRQVLSFRSTEFADDAARDNQVTNTLEVHDLGWAVGQMASMRAWEAETLPVLQRNFNRVQRVQEVVSGHSSHCQRTGALG